MKTEVTEIADKIYRLSTFVPQIGPNGFTFNQFLIDADEPLLFHYGQRAMFPLITRRGEERDPARQAALDDLQPCRGRRNRARSTNGWPPRPTPRRRTARSASTSG